MRGSKHSLGRFAALRSRLDFPSALRQAKFYVVFAIGPSAEAKAACEESPPIPRRRWPDTRAAYAERVQDLFQKLPRLESSNPALVRLYNRSLVHLLMNRWDVPEFVLHPYYSTGSVKGGCVCNYLWNFGETWEILPLYDPAASRDAHQAVPDDRHDASILPSSRSPARPSAPGTRSTRRRSSA